MYVRTTQSKSLPGGRIAPALKAAAITAFLFAALTPVLTQEPAAGVSRYQPLPQLTSPSPPSRQEPW